MSDSDQKEPKPTPPTSPIVTTTSDTEPPRVYVLIHGTFARQTQWVQQGSLTCSTLESNSSVEPVLLRYQWSGRNSHRARLKAGMRLRRRLRKLHREYPDSELFLIAHSHGGNVALYALDDPEVAESVTGVITLGTPFLQVQRKALADPTRILSTALAVLSGVFWILLIVGAVLLSGCLEWSMGWTFLGVMTFVGLSAWLVRRIPCQRWTISLVRRAAHAQRAVRQLQLPKALSVPILRIAVRGDEARILLTLSNFAGLVPTYVWNALVLLLTLLLPMSGLTYLGGLYQESLFGYGLIAFFVWLGLLLLAVLSQLVMMACTRLVRYVAFGPESLAERWLTSIRPVVDPPGLACLGRDFNFGRQWGRWNHCRIYEEPAVLEEICSWCENPSAPECSQSSPAKGGFLSAVHQMLKYCRRRLR